MLRPALSLLIGYLCGSVSFAYLAGRLFAGVDLRRYGSRKLSASNAYNFWGVPGLIGVGVLDACKALLPAWLMRRMPGWGLTCAVLAGVGAVLGHNWSIYLGLYGGRGVGAALGMMVVIFAPGVLWLLLWVAILGRLVPRYAALPGLVGILTLPLLAVLWPAPRVVVYGCLAIALIIIAKRLEGNRQPLSRQGSERQGSRWGVLWRRLLYDRDISDFETWMAHEPED